MSIFKKDKLRQSSAQERQENRANILLVDDEPDNLFVLKQLLSSEFNVLTAESGSRALELIDGWLDKHDASDPIHLIISDQRMPAMSGTQFLALSKERMPHTVRVLLTGYSDIDAVIDAVNEAQIFRYLSKPAQGEELIHTIRSGLEMYQLRDENQKLLVNLANSYEKIRALDEDKLAFLRFLSHEINTPLNWIGAIQIVNRKTVSDEMLQILDFVDQGREQLKELIFTVLRYFERAGEEVAIYPKLCHLKHLLDMSVNMARVHLKKDCDSPVRVQVDSNITATLDEKLMIECLSYLVQNALLFSAGREVLVRAEVSTQAKDRVIIRVEDAERVMDPEQLAELFHPFARIVPSTSENGFGLNLPMCHFLIQALGGRVWAENMDAKVGVAYIVDMPQQVKAN